MPTEPHTDLDRALGLAERLADAARVIARQHFRRPIAIEQKPDNSPVTVADRAIETELRRLIRAEFPTHAIQGEEFANEPGRDFTWVLDPIDGTKSFICGMPLFGTLIALMQGDRAVIGIVESPASAERWVGCTGRPTRLNGEPARTSRCTELQSARIYTTSPDAFRGDEWRRYDAVSRQAGLRRFGGDCYSYGLLASGHCDLVIESALKPHDYLALIPVIEGAGGKVTDWEGEPLGLHSSDRIVAAATEALWSETIEALGRAR
ncbi:MAG TPA: histidinol-phosphatase [Steroidobacteraceae bacterium]|nr:histidinol-phosphatase [Steroidobacteraceae bacterium]